MFHVRRSEVQTVGLKDIYGIHCRAPFFVVHLCVACAVVSIRAFHQKTYETVHWTTFINHVWLIFILLLIIFSFIELASNTTQHPCQTTLSLNPPFLNATIYHCPRYLLHRVNKSYVDALIFGYVIIWLVNHFYQSLAWLLGEDQFTARRDFSTSPHTGHKYLPLKKSNSVSLLLPPPMYSYQTTPPIS